LQTVCEVRAGTGTEGTSGGGSACCASGKRKKQRNKYKTPKKQQPQKGQAENKKTESERRRWDKQNQILAQAEKEKDQLNVLEKWTTGGKRDPCSRGETRA